MFSGCSIKTLMFKFKEQMLKDLKIGIACLGHEL